MSGPVPSSGLGTAPSSDGTAVGSSTVGGGEVTVAVGQSGGASTGVCAGGTSSGTLPVGPGGTVTVGVAQSESSGERPAPLGESPGPEPDGEARGLVSGPGGTPDGPMSGAPASGGRTATSRCPSSPVRRSIQVLSSRSMRVTLPSAAGAGVTSMTSPGR